MRRYAGFPNWQVTDTKGIDEKKWVKFVRSHAHACVAQPASRACPAILLVRDLDLLAEDGREPSELARATQIL